MTSKKPNLPPQLYTLTDSLLEERYASLRERPKENRTASYFLFAR